MSFNTPISIADLTGTPGFLLYAAAGSDRFGASVASADVNGDGYDDLIVGAPAAAIGGVNSGSTYVVFGGAAGLPNGLDLGTLGGTNGYRIDGYAVSITISGTSGDYYGFNDQGEYVYFPPVDYSYVVSHGIASGSTVSAAGDVNGDGRADFLIAAPGTDVSETVWLVYGGTSPAGGSGGLATLDPAMSLRFGGEPGGRLGASLASLGDVNGDGLAVCRIQASGTA